MQVKAVYRQEVMDEGTDNERTVHAVDHDGGGFIVSSKEVGVAVQNFMHYAKPEDLRQLHNHLLWAYAQELIAMSKLPEANGD